MERLFPSHFLSQARCNPNAVAVLDPARDFRLTYEELELQSRQIAVHLRRLGAGTDTRIGILLDRSPEMVVAAVAVLRAGAAYVPIDPDQPLPRLRELVDDAEPAAVLTRTREARRALAGGAVLCRFVRLDFDIDPEAPAPASELPEEISPTATAYVIYTSGSTGLPKGVMVEHRSLAWYVETATKVYERTHDKRTLQFSSLSFDVSVAEIFPVLAHGGTLVLRDEDDARSVTKLLARCRDSKINALLLPTSLWHEIAVAVAAGRELPSSLRLVNFGTEQVSMDRIKDWLSVRPQARLINSYGATETTIDISCGEVEARADGKISVGRPLPGVLVRIVDQRLREVAPGETGQVAVAGPGLARGYLRRAALTAKSFVPLPDSKKPGARFYLTGDLGRWLEDGELEVLGRVDEQVKVRGFRIEPGEIEALLERHPTVRRAAVVVWRGSGTARLVAYMVSRSGTEIEPVELRTYLYKRLPVYMVPSAFVSMAALPMTLSEKIDRAALRRLPPPRLTGPAVAYRTPREEQLAGIWAEVLRVEQVGVHDNFFDLGGDSILNLRIAARAHEAGIRLQPRDVLRHPTISELVASGTVEDAAPEPPPQQDSASGPIELTPIQRWFFELEMVEPWYFNQSELLNLRQPLKASVLRQALGVLMEHHEALRLRFEQETDGSWNQRSVPFDGRVPQVCVDLRSLPVDRRETAAVQAANAAQASLDIGRGPLFRAALMTLGPDEERLLLAIHHLAIDTVSWHILLNDLELLCEQIAAGKPPRLPNSTTSYREWSRRLAEHAQGFAPAPGDEAARQARADARRELEYWRHIPRRVPALPYDREPTVQSRRADMDLVEVTFAAEQTDQLLHHVPAAYRTRINDLLLTALMRTVTDWTGRDEMLVELESHGREDVLPGIDLSRTVGWFTTAYPVLLQNPPGGGLGDSLIAVKEKLRTVPRHGFGFFLMRQMGTPSVRQEIAGLALPEMSFNYFGQLDGMSSPLFSIQPENPAAGRRHSPRGRSLLDLEVDGGVAGGQLVIRWYFSRRIYHRSTVERLAERYHEELTALIKHCTTPGIGALTPSDFPLAGLNAGTLKRLVAELDEDTEVEDVYPLTPVQEGLFFHALLDPASAVYFEQSSWALTGSLNVDAFREAWDRLLHRHEILRTSFVWLGNQDKISHGGFRQVVHRHQALPFKKLQWDPAPPDVQAQRLEDFLAEDRRRGFDLSRAPLWRVHLVQLGKDYYRLVFSNHHILLDGWSVSLVMEEFFEVYDALDSGQVPERAWRRPFRDYVAWLGQQNRPAAEDFWRGELRGFQGTAPLAMEKSPQGLDGSSAFATGYPLAGDRVRRFAQECRVTLATVVQAAWAFVLARTSGHEDVIFGATNSGRPAALPGADEIVGLLIHTLPIRVRVGRQPLPAWLRGLQERAQLQRQHGHVTLADIRGWSGLDHEGSLFESLIGFHNYPGAAALDERQAGMEVGELIYFSQTNYALDLGIHPHSSAEGWDSGLQFQMRFDPARFDHPTVLRLLRSLRTTLIHMAEQPSQKLTQISLLAASERHQLLVEWSEASWHDAASSVLPETFLPSTKADLIHDLVSAQAQLTPERIAVVDGERNLTYRELENLADSQAAGLRSRGMGPEERAAICLERRLELIVTILAVLKTGGAFVPLAPEHPEDRRRRLLRETGASLLIDREGVHDLWEAEPVDGRPSPTDKPCPANLAYIIGTSGTTGRPKGVAIEHRQFISYLRAVCLRLGRPPRQELQYLLAYSPAFDASFQSVFVAMTTGGTLHVLGEQQLVDPWLVEDYIDSKKIDVLDISPRHLLGLEEALGRRLRPRWRIGLGGDTTDRSWADEFIAADLPFVVNNQYGPTETVCAITLGRADGALSRQVAASPRLRAVPAIPLGRPLSHARAYVVDDALTLVASGAPGELVLAGRSLARGYFQRPARTATAFVPNPFSEIPGERLYKSGDLARFLNDGQLEILGRRDQQLKILGVRLEPGEVEARLCDHPAVQESVVQLRDAKASELVAFVRRAGRFDASDQGMETWQEEQVRNWRERYSQRFVEGERPSLDASWLNVHTGRSIPSEQRQEWVETTINRILELGPSLGRVLELGCGIGTFCLRLAPFASSVLAIDMSETAIERLTTSCGDLPIEARCQPLDDFRGIEEATFDLVVINSVAQYLPSMAFFKRMLSGALDALAPGGHLYVGDVLSLPLQELHAVACEIERANPETPAHEIEAAIKRRMEAGEQLVVHPAYFHELSKSDDRMGEVVVRPKGGRHHNELTRFSYDVLVSRRPPGATEGKPLRVDGVAWIPWYEGLTYQSVGDLLARHQGQALGLRGVPDQRLWQEIRLRELLAVAPATVGALCDEVDALGPYGLVPDDLARICREHSYQLELTFSEDTVDNDTLNYIFRPIVTKNATIRGRDVLDTRITRPWASYGNRPLAKAVQEVNDTWEKDVVDQWRDVHSFHAVDRPVEDAAFDFAGWNSSYTGRPIPADEMREWVEATVERIRRLGGERILEIGCGHGLLLHRLAPATTRYLGTDLSPAVLDTVRSYLQDAPLPQVRLREQAADNFKGIESGSFETIIINSVIQYFPSVAYLKRVLNGAVEAAAPGASIFVGDVRRLSSLEAFYASVELYRADEEMTVLDLRRAIRRRRAQERELVIDHDFFSALAEEIPRICQVVILPKAEKSWNEMTLFRDDVILKLDTPLADDLESDLLELHEAAEERLRPIRQQVELLSLCQGSEKVAEIRETALQEIAPDLFGLHPQHRNTLIKLEAELRSDLEKRLPPEMIPSTITVLDALPRLPGGRPDRAALAARSWNRKDSRVTEAPRTATETFLVSLWCEVLGIQQVGIHDNFFKLGGHSLSGTQLVSRIRRHWEIDLPLRTLFEAPTIAELALAVDEEAQEELETPPLTKVSRPARLPLSFAQQRLWFHDQIAPGSVTYHVLEAWQMIGPINIDAFRSAWREVVKRHEALRTSFADDDGEPFQVISSQPDVDLLVVDLQNLSAGISDDKARHLAAMESLRPFDLSAGPVLRLVLFQLSDHRSLLLRVLHHIASDGWSAGILQRELSILYTAAIHDSPASLPRLPIQYADFALWQRDWLQGRALEIRLDWWRQQLAGLETLKLPCDRPHPPVRRYQGRMCPFSLPTGLTTQLEEISQSHQGSLFMSVLAGYLILLGRLSGMNDVTVGAPIANRNHQEVEGLIGFFVNSLVLRFDLAGNPTVNDLFEQLRETTLAAYAHQDLPFEKLVEELQPERELDKNPFFQVVFAFQNVPDFEMQLPGLECHTTDIGVETMVVDLELHLWPQNGGLEGYLTYDPDLFDATRITRFAGQLEGLLHEIASHPQRRLVELSLLTQPERHQILHEWSDIPPSMPLAESWLELFESTTLRYPEYEALRSRDGNLTYRELHQRAVDLAEELRHYGLQSEDRVALMLGRSTEHVIAMIAVLAAGGAFLALDPGFPDERLRLTIEDAQATLVLKSRRYQDRRIGANDRILLWEELYRVKTAESPPPIISGDQLAYVIYTSGSTGRPKGTLVTHRGLANLVRSSEKRPLPGQVALQFSSLSFDAMISEIAYTLASGATLDLATDGGSPTGEDLAELLQHRKIQWAILPPSVLHTLPGDVELDDLKTVISAGEACTVDLPAKTAFRGTRFLNAYGPTEVTICASVAWCPIGEEPSIGRPLPGVTMFVLDRELRLLPMGSPGEIGVGGVGVARGYLGQPRTTAQRFVPNPFDKGPGSRLYLTGDRARCRPDGRFDFLGRDDDQIKLRGIRIELGEVEAALHTHSSVRHAVVEVRRQKAGNVLHAFVVPTKSADEKLTRTLRQDLSRQLPLFMIPGKFTVVDALPLLASGKVDRRSLAAAPAKGSARQGHLTATEMLLASIWREVLQVETVGVDDDFFELGGHSLLATQIRSRIRQQLGWDVDLRSLFAAPTIGQLVALYQKEKPATVDADAIMPRSRHLPAPLSFAQERLWLVDRLYPGSRTYNNFDVWHLKGRLDVHALTNAFDEIVRRHEVLRTVFPSRHGQPVQEILPASGTSFLRIDVDRLPREKRLEESRKKAGELADIAFDLSSGPLLHCGLFRLGDEEWQLVRTLHHIVTDGWSEGLFVRELAVLYQAICKRNTNVVTSPLNRPKLQYADFAAWQRRRLTGKELERLASYWRQRLQGLEPLALATDRPRPAAPATRGGEVNLVLKSASMEKLSRVLQVEGASVFMLLLATLSGLLMRLTGQTDLAVGSPVANRNRRETEEIFGFFVNLVVLRAHLPARASFREMLRQARQNALEAFAHQELPFEKLVEDFYSPDTRGNAPKRDPARNPLFQVSLALLNTPRTIDIRLPGVNVEEQTIDKVNSRFDLAWHLLPSESDPNNFHGYLVYRKSLFDRTTALRMVRSFESLIDAAAFNPDGALGEMSLLSRAERHQLCLEWGVPGDVPDRGSLDISELFFAQVARSPDHVAMTMGSESWTYGELAVDVRRLAGRLVSLGIGPEVCVGLFLNRGPELIKTALATLAAGAAYVPLDPRAPAENLSLCLATTHARAVFTSESLEEKLPPDNELPVLRVDNEDVSEPLPINGNFSSQRMAYVLMTSGSTGQPKGVAVAHAQVAAYVRAIQERFRLAPGWGYALVQPLHVDSSVTTVFGALLTGGTLHLVADNDALSPVALTKLFNERRVDVLKIAPSHLAALNPAPKPRRRLIVGGEAALEEQVAEWRSHAEEECEIHNHYGPTEATVGVLSARLGEGDVVLGRPLGHARTLVVDERLEIVPQGIVGELAIGGEAVTRGYLGRPALTAASFVPDEKSVGGRLYRSGDLVRFRSDGCLEFLGRRDRQVKVRGFRIELSEVENVLVSHPSLREAAVVVVADRLIAHVVPATENAETLRAWLQRRLPPQMVPAFLVGHESLPRHAHGKLDRNALTRLPVHEKQEQAISLDAVEELLKVLWQDVLDIRTVGREDDFFELGGHSLLAVRLQTRLDESLGREVPLAAVFEHPTVAGLAAYLAQRPDLDGRDPLKRRLSQHGLLPLSLPQERMWNLMRDSGNAAGTWNLSLWLERRDAPNLGVLLASLAAVVRKHEALRIGINDLSRDHRNGNVPEVILTSTTKITFTDLSGLPTEAARLESQRLSRREAARPFRLTADEPLHRFLLIRIAPDQHNLLAVFHHLIFDGLSRGIFIRELHDAEKQSPRLHRKTSVVGYCDFATWQRRTRAKQRLAAAKTYWEQLRTAPRLFNTPPEAGRRPVSFLSRDLSADLLKQLRGAAQASRTTLFLYLLSAYVIGLRRLAKTSLITVGCPIADRSHRQLEGMIGLLSNALLLQAEVQEETSFPEVHQQLRTSLLQGHANQEVPWQELFSDQPLQGPLSEAHFDLVEEQRSAPAKTDEPGWDILESPDTALPARYPLMLSALTGKVLRLELSFDPAYFEHDEIVELMQTLEDVLQQQCSAASPLNQL